MDVSGRGQIAMRITLDRYLEQLDFDLDGFAERWYPLGRAEPVVVDPKIEFGSPTVVGTRVPTEAIAELYDGPESVDEIVWWYGLTPEQVHAAIRLERGLSAAA